MHGQQNIKKKYSSQPQLCICNTEQHNDPIKVTVALIRQPWEGYPESIVSRGMWLGTRETEGRAALRLTKLLNCLAVGLQHLTKSPTCASHDKDEKSTQNLPRKTRKEERLKVDRWIRV